MLVIANIIHVPSLTIKCIHTFEQVPTFECSNGTSICPGAIVVHITIRRTTTSSTTILQW